VGDGVLKVFHAEQVNRGEEMHGNSNRMSNDVKAAGLNESIYKESVVVSLAPPRSWVMCSHRNQSIANVSPDILPAGNGPREMPRPLISFIEHKSMRPGNALASTGRGTELAGR
jgi:hypothetical protein